MKSGKVPEKKPVENRETTKSEKARDGREEWERGSSATQQGRHDGHVDESGAILDEPDSGKGS